jgi:CDP-2,3-bis-(O-geranylgeranyl)-sn-glycerol synthase
MNALIVAFWLMLPAYIPNNCAALFGGGTPLDGGRIFSDGRRTLGDGKTYRGTIAGTVCGILVGLLQNQIAPARPANFWQRLEQLFILLALSWERCWGYRGCFQAPHGIADMERPFLS